MQKLYIYIYNYIMIIIGTLNDWRWNVCDRGSYSLAYQKYSHEAFGRQAATDSYDLEWSLYWRQRKIVAVRACAWTCSVAIMAVFHAILRGFHVSYFHDVFSSILDQTGGSRQTNSRIRQGVDGKESLSYNIIVTVIPNYIIINIAGPSAWYGNVFLRLSWRVLFPIRSNRWKPANKQQNQTRSWW